MSHLTLSCFGAFQASLDSERLTSFHSVKVQGLLAYLALEADRPHHRETLTALLWPLDAEASARNSLRQALYELRKLLGDNDGSPTPFLLVTRQTVQFNPASNHALDVADFLASLENGELEQAAALYRGDLLAGLHCDSEPFEEWLRLWRERLHNLAVDALYQLSQRSLEQGQYKSAQQYAQRQLVLEPWREEAHRQLMTALALGGERSAALAQYETCRQIVAEELGGDPDSETTALYEQIKAGKVRGQAPLPQPSQKVGEGAVTHPALPPHNLPPQPTPFIGRSDELAQLARRLSDPHCRLLTLVGHGGMGKTRLAIQTAQQIVDLGLMIDDAQMTPQDNPQSEIPNLKFADGVFFVTLAGVGTADLLVPTIAAALDLNFYGGTDLKTQLFNQLRAKSLLLVLDNVEHLLDGIDLVADLLASAPQVKVLTTSREPLNLQEEWLFPVGGMQFPASGSTVTADDAEALLAYSAVQLFVRCAQRVRPGFDLLAERDHVLHICRLVEGMPLAIELAAAWLKLFPCAQIAQEVERSLDFLATSLRNVPARHRSMRAVFEHSWRLLSGAEQQVLQQLAVFRGGFQQEAAVQVAGASFPVLVALAEKSLLQLTPGGRFQLHELLRQFAEEKLLVLPQEAEQAHDRHCVYYLSFLRQQEHRLKGKEHRTAMAEVETEMENIRMAWQWAIAHQKMSPIGQALESLFYFYFAKSWWQEGENVFQQAAEALAMDEPDGEQGILLGKLLARQGFMTSYIVGEVGEAGAQEQGEHFCQQSLAILNRLGKQHETGTALNALGMLFFKSGRFEQGTQLTKQALAMFTEKGDRWGMMLSLGNLGFVTAWTGKYRDAIAYYRQGIALGEEQGAPVFAGDLMSVMAEAYEALGEYVEALQAAQAALALVSAARDKRSIAWALQVLGDLAWRMGDYTTAQQHSQESLALFQEVGLSSAARVAMNNLGHIACSLGDYCQARAHFWAVLAANAKTGSLHLLWQVAEAMTGMATVLLQEGQPVQAVEVLYHVLRHPAAWQETKDRAQLLLSELAAQLPPHVIAAAQARAESQDLAATVAELLSAS